MLQVITVYRSLEGVNNRGGEEVTHFGTRPSGALGYTQRVEIFLFLFRLEDNFE